MTAVSEAGITATVAEMQKPAGNLLPPGFLAVWAEPKPQSPLRPLPRLSQHQFTPGTRPIHPTLPDPAPPTREYFRPPALEAAAVGKSGPRGHAETVPGPGHRGSGRQRALISGVTTEH